MNISRPDFCKAINTSGEDKLNEVKDIFDEIMALYNIVSEDYVSVTKIRNTENLVEFSVKFDSVEKAEEIYSRVNYKETIIYGKPVQLVCWRSDSPDTLSIHFHTLNG